MLDIPYTFLFLRNQSSKKGQLLRNVFTDEL